MTVLSYISSCVISSSPSGTTGLSFGMVNLHEIHDRTLSHSELLKKGYRSFHCYVIVTVFQNQKLLDRIDFVYLIGEKKPGKSD